MALLNRLSRALQGAARSSTALLPRRTRTADAAVVAFAQRPQARALLEEFEPRVLYSADTPLALLGDAVVRLAADPAPAAAPAADAGSSAAQSTAAAATAAHEIAFVDTQVADYQRLVADLQRQADAGRPIEVHLLDAGEDGIRQITDTLQGRQDLTAVHIFSHGIDGAVELGGAWLNAYSLEARADSIAQWRAALAPGADLLLYGCDVAADADGQAFIGRLAELTGADVAASRDATGSAALGGNWNLEVDHRGDRDGRGDRRRRRRRVRRRCWPSWQATRLRDRHRRQLAHLHAHRRRGANGFADRQCVVPGAVRSIRSPRSATAVWH